MDLNYSNRLFSGWEIAVTKKVAKQFKAKCPCIHRDDVNDLTEECLSHWLIVRNKYDLEKIEYPKSFLAKVVTNYLSIIVESRLRKKRSQYFQAVSLDQFLEENSDSPFLANPVQHNPSGNIDLEELKAKIDQTVKKLSSQQKQVLSALRDGQLDITAISVRLKVHRSTVYNEINRIKEVFENEGLRKYLL